MEISREPRVADLGARDRVDREAIAAALVDAWQHGTFVEAPTRVAPRLSKADALAIAERVRALRVGAGARVVGYKVGFTNQTVRDQFAAEGPFALPVYDTTLQATPRIAAGALLGPRIEPEVVVGIGAGGEPAWAALGFEIVQSHVRDWQFGYLDALVDFGLHAALIVGERRPLDGDLAWLAEIDVELRRDGEVVERGRGADVDGGALGSLEWLRGDLRRAERDLQPGEIVTTGSMTRVPPIAPGERWSLTCLGGEFAPLTIDVA